MSRAGWGEDRSLPITSTVSEVSGTCATLCYRSLKDHLLAMPDVGDDSDFVIKRSRARPVTL